MGTVETQTVGSQLARTTEMEIQMNALLKAAKHSIRQETFENYTIAVVCGIVIGVMLGLAV